MEERKLSDSEDGIPGNGMWRWFNIVVVACILALSALLGVLNNLRFADERKVKWFGPPADQDEQETSKEVEP